MLVTRVDVTPPGCVRLGPHTRVGDLRGKNVPIKVDDEIIGVAYVENVEVVGGRLLADLAMPPTVFQMINGDAAPNVSIHASPEQLHLTRALRPRVRLASIADFDREFGPSPGVAAALYSAVDRAFSGVVLNGGFRTRSRVRKLRIAAALSASVPQMVAAQWGMLDSAIYEEDNQRVCPHAPRWRTPLDRETDICAACGTAFPRREIHGG